MAFDAHKNLAIATVTTATGAAGTTLGVTAGQGARFPAVPFNATVWPFDQAPTPANAEVVRVTALAGDSLTITRAQEGTTARAIVVGDLVAATITAKSLTDIESGVNFPLITTPGLVTTSGVKVTATAGLITPATSDGADNAYLLVGGGGAGSPDRGAYFGLFGNEYPGAGGLMTFAAGTGAGGNMDFYTGSASALAARIHRSGGVSVGGGAAPADPGAGNLSAGGHLIAGTMRQDLTTGQLTLSGGSDIGVSAYINMYGSGHPTPTSAGALHLVSPSVNGIIYNTTHAGAAQRFFLTGVERGRMHPSGGFSWGGVTDPGAGHLSAVAFDTISDARLKTPLGRHTDPDVLRKTVIHNFEWKSDGTAGRGVFAQEAYAVAPFAVSVGGDDVDDQGRLVKPWGVDYSKYVPDLIAGWQQHDAVLAALSDQIATIRNTSAATGTNASRIRPWVAQLYQRVREACAVWVPAWIWP